MTKNNYLLKFAYLYITNIKGIKEEFGYVWDEICDKIGDLLIILITLIALVIKILSIVFPLKQILLAFHIQYVNPEEMKELYSDDEAGYYSKSSIKKRKAVIQQEMEET